MYRNNNNSNVIHLAGSVLYHRYNYTCVILRRGGDSKVSRVASKNCLSTTPRRIDTINLETFPCRVALVLMQRGTVNFLLFFFFFSFLHLHNENKYYSDHVLYILHLLLHSIVVYRSLVVYIVCIEKKLRKKTKQWMKNRRRTFKARTICHRRLFDTISYCDTIGTVYCLWLY